MTTRITVDTHAGWPVLVVQLVGEPNREKTVQTTIVPPQEVRDFYIHSGMKIISIEEQPAS